MLPISFLHALTDVIHTCRKYKDVMHKRICTHNRETLYTHTVQRYCTRLHTHTHNTETLHTCTHTIQKHFTYPHNTETLHTHPCVHTHTHTHTHTLKKYRDIVCIHTQYRDAMQTYPRNTHNIDAKHTTHTQFTHDTIQTPLSTTSIVDRITIRCAIFITIIDWNCEMLQQ